MDSGDGGTFSDLDDRIDSTTLEFENTYSEDDIGKTFRFYLSARNINGQVASNIV